MLFSLAEQDLLSQLYNYPSERPFAVSHDGCHPAIVHPTDFSLVTTTKPARAGEILLTLFAGDAVTISVQ